MRVNRAVIVGGFTEGKSVLDPVAKAVCEAGLAEEADVFTFRDAMENTRKVNRAVRGQKIYTHSAGIMAIRQDAKFSALNGYNGPEPGGIGKLVVASLLKKTPNHALKTVTGPDRDAHLRCIASNTAELTRHPVANLRWVPEISRFSTKERAIAMASGGLAVELVAMEDDEYDFARSDDYEEVPPGLEGKLTIVTVPGHHDALLTDPAGVLSAVAHAQQAA